MTTRVCLILCLAVHAICQSSTAADSSISIENGCVVDVVAGEIKKNMDVLVEGDRIKAVAARGTLVIPAGATRVDAAGKYIIPGLWDMHIHWYHAPSMALFPLNGVTGTRIMWGGIMHHRWREKFESGDELGPRLVIGSAIIDGPNPIWPGSLVAADEAGGIEVLKKAQAAGADFAKVYSLLPRDAYFAIAAEAKRLKLPFVGHVPLMVSVGEASEAGQRSMEHLYEILLACSSAEEELRSLRSATVAEQGEIRGLFADRQALGDFMRRTIDTYDQTKARSLFETLRKNDTWQCPTLTVLRNLAYITEPEVQENEYLEYIPPIVKTMIAPSKDPRGRTDEQIEASRIVYLKNLSVLSEMHEAGVPILAGTDCLNPFCLPGFSLHGELELLVQAGLSPLDALRTATINPARFLGREKDLGSITTGRLADLVVLNKNPLESIGNTREIFAVMLRGELLDSATIRTKLDAFKDEPG